MVNFRHCIRHTRTDLKDSKTFSWTFMFRIREISSLSPYHKISHLLLMVRSLFIMLCVYSYLHVTLQSANEEYSKKLTETSTDTTLMSLAWNVDKLSCWNQQGHKLVIEVSVMKNKLNDISDLVSNNVTRQLTWFFKRYITTCIL